MPPHSFEHSPETAGQGARAVTVAHVSVCVCTFRRPDLLQRLLHSLEGQVTNGTFTYSVTVVDNDATGSAQRAVSTFAANARVRTAYCVEPEQNIALARNRAVRETDGKYVAFMDDDEFPVSDWLQRLIETCVKTGADGVLGPVRPHFVQSPPAWIVRGGFCERREYTTGTIVPWYQSRTGNLLFHRSVLRHLDVPFRAQFGTGGEDVDFFQRLAAKGCVFVWCNEAAAYEDVTPQRCTRSYMLHRALLRGRNNLKLSRGRTRLILVSVVAVPAYLLFLPVAFLLGQHVVMNYAIRCCDHLGRLLTIAGINPAKQRTN